jgi:hypothetical protein
MKIGFLFGAGVSLPDAPTTKELTDILLKGDNVHRLSDGTYRLSKEKNPALDDPESIQRIRSLLEFLRRQADDFFSQRKLHSRTAHYEDLYYSVTQLADAVDDYENPAVGALLVEAEQRFAMPQLPCASGFQSNDLFEETRRYIKGIISHSLISLQPPQGHLRQIVQAAKDECFSRVEIFTLNHDPLIERTLEKEGIPFSNGFVKLNEDLHSWDRESFAESRVKVRLIKLHGSVDWYPMRFSPPDASIVCISTNGDPEHARGPNGRPPHLLPDRPVMLVGTFNKMMEYTMGIYADLFCAFRTALWSLDSLIVSGYSFSDKGVNASLVEWTRQNRERRLLIIAPHASDYAQTARGAIRHLFSDCGAQIEKMNEKFKDADWNQIRAWHRMRR